MRIVKVANFYKSFFGFYNNEFPEILTKSYQEQYNHLMNQYVGWSDFYSKALRKQGIEAFEIVYNATHMQNQWAKENNVQGQGLEILTAQLKHYNPDIIWFQDSFSFDAQYMNSFRTILPNLKLLIGNSCAPYTSKNLENLKIFDFVTTCSPKFVQEFEANGLKTLLLYHAFEPTILPEIEAEKKIDFIFIGSIVPRKNYHIQRKSFLEEIAANPNINFTYYGNLTSVTLSEVLKQQFLYIVKEFLIKTGASKFFKNSFRFKKMENLDSFPKYFKFSKEIKQAYKGQLYGKNMFKELAKSKVTLDIQVEAEGDYAGNMRMFETSGAGVCLLLEDKINIPDIFEPEKEVIIYKSFEDAMEKIIWLLNNEDKRKEIAKAGQRRVLRDHTYDLRAKQLVEEIEKYLIK
ncbi:MAG: glycosyltransferase family 1 protein [Bacteroidales bacterium]|nr:glycosyltransferase family 1 protein [Bacteroidales bacterium]